MTETEKLMVSHGFTLVRTGKHQVWKNGEGDTVVTSISPSCPRVLKNIKRDIRLAEHRRKKPGVGRKDGNMTKKPTVPQKKTKVFDD